MPGEDSLEGKRALVTGASRGMGEAIAVELASRGSDVAVTARSQKQLEDTVTRVAGFRASPEASYVNGAVFVVDGGESL